MTKRWKVWVDKVTKKDADILCQWWNENSVSRTEYRVLKSISPISRRASYCVYREKR